MKFWGQAPINIKYIAMKKVFIIFLLFFPVMHSIAQQKNGGKPFTLTGSKQILPTDTASLASLRAAVEASPDSLNVHEKFIKAFRKSIPHLTFTNQDSALSVLAHQYKAWIQRFPQSAIVPYAIGNEYADAELPEARPYLLKAVSLDPKLAKAWEDLWIDAERWGDFAAGREYLAKAMQADPANPEYAFYYASSFSNIDPAKYRKLSLNVAKNFPDNERGAQSLYWLAFSSTDQKDKVTIYEQLRTKFPPGKFDWSAGGMSEYFDLLLQTDPAKAVTLAQSMTRLKLADDDLKEWNNQLTLAKKIAQAHKFLNEHRPADAEKILTGATVNRWSSAREAINLLKAKAIAANGNAKTAYDSLLVFFAKEPGDKTKAALWRYGAKIGKSAEQVNADVWQGRDATARPAEPFTLAAYLTPDSVSLSDYRGKIVLLTFWFPGCGPCRGEFPHFQKVLNKFKSQDIAYLGINVFPGQDEYVAPFMKSSGYGFTPLHENGENQEKAYKVRGEPSNFLIDRQGRIIFSGFMIQNAREEQMLNLMISSMLSRQK